jgi:hypothetical protein
VTRHASPAAARAGGSPSRRSSRSCCAVRALSAPAKARRWPGSPRRGQPRTVSSSRAHGCGSPGAPRSGAEPVIPPPPGRRPQRRMAPQSRRATVPASRWSERNRTAPLSGRSTRATVNGIQKACCGGCSRDGHQLRARRGRGRCGLRRVPWCGGQERSDPPERRGGRPRSADTSVPSRRPHGRRVQHLGAGDAGGDGPSPTRSAGGARGVRRSGEGAHHCCHRRSDAAGRAANPRSQSGDP